MRRHLAVALVVLALGAGVATTAARARFEGLRLQQALERLQQGGLLVLFSSELVRPDMRVEREPRAVWPREILDELLRSHGLRAEAGPGGTLLVVPDEATGAIEGTIVAAGGGAPLPGWSVRVPALGKDVRTDRNGRFEVRGIPPQTYTLELRRAGGLVRELEGVPVSPGATTRVRFALDREDATVERIVVRSDGQASSRTAPELRVVWPEGEAAVSPETHHDPLLAVSRLPGVGGADGSGGLHVRGSSADELSIVLDGFRLYDPYHLRDRGRSISVIDSRDIGAMRLLDGAATAEYGGQTGGVLELDAPPSGEETATEADWTTDDLRAAHRGTAGLFDGFVSVRRGDPSPYLEAMGADPGYRPRFWDGHARVGIELGPRTRLGVHALRASELVQRGEAEPAITVDEAGSLKSAHRSSYTWLALEHTFARRLHSRTIVGTSRLVSEREGTSPRLSALRDDREADVSSLRSDWLHESGRHLFKWGLELERASARYRYVIAPAPDAAAELPPRDLVARPEAHTVGVYVADHLELTPELRVELGLRWDRSTHSAESTATWGPRANVAWALSERTTLRVGWGRHAQPQRVHELAIGDGVTALLAPRRAEHRLLAVERAFGPWQGALTLYQKVEHDPPPRFENALDPFDFFPETVGDRIRIDAERGRSQGVELMLRDARPGRLDGWIGYAVSWAEELDEGAWVARSWDERHALEAGLRWRPMPAWDVALAAGVRSGRPTTPADLELATTHGGEPVPLVRLGRRNSVHLPPFQRIDLRVARNFDLGRMRLATFAGVTNLLDRRNVVAVEQLDLTETAEGPGVDPDLRHGLPRRLTFGVSVRF